MNRKAPSCLAMFKRPPIGIRTRSTQIADFYVPPVTRYLVPCHSAWGGREPGAKGSHESAPGAEGSLGRKGAWGGAGWGVREAGVHPATASVTGAEGPAAAGSPRGPGAEGKWGKIAPGKVSKCRALKNCGSFRSAVPWKTVSHTERQKKGEELYQ